MIQKTELEVDYGQAEEFAAAVWEPDDRIEIRPIGRDGIPLASTFPPAESVSHAIGPRHVMADVYFGANPRLRVGGTEAADVALARCVFADFDFDDEIKTSEDVSARIAEKNMPKPTITVGSGNGIQAWWRLAEPIHDLAKFTEIQKRIARHLGSDPKVIDPPRIMRLPGTFNQRDKRFNPATGKREKALLDVPKPVRLIEHGPARHDLATIESVLPELPPEPPKKVFEPIDYERPEDASLDRRVFAYLDKCDRSIEGDDGSGELFGALCSVADKFDLDERGLRRAADYYNSTKCEPPWSDKELDHKIRDALKQKGTRRQVGSAFVEDEARKRPERVRRQAPNASPPENNDKATVPDAENTEGAKHRTESEFSKRVARECGHHIRWVEEWKAFAVWNGQVWMRDSGTRTDERIRNVAKSFLLETEAAIETGELGDAKEALKHAVYLNSARGKNAIRDLLRSEPGIAVSADVFDADPFLLNVQNGVVDLRTGVLLAHDAKLMQSKIAATIYDRAATCPTFERVVSEAMEGDPERVGYVRRLLGYALTGDVREQKLPIWYGSGSNGKGTIVEAVTGLMNEYAATGAPDLLMVKGEAHPTELAVLAGARLVICSENEEGKRLAEARVKLLTGGDTLTARRMREDYWRFRPTHKLLLQTNHKPALRGTDHGIKRRLHLLHFKVIVPEDRQDKSLPEKLRAEWPGILQWLIGGCVEWQQGGLNAPGEVLRATNEYLASEDVVGRFIGDVCTVRPDLTVRARDIYAAYRDWCVAVGEKPASQKVFGPSLQERGYEKFVSNGTWYSGIYCKPPAPKADSKGGTVAEPSEPSDSETDDRYPSYGEYEPADDVLDG
jgi:putative DNA primase/helicase